MPNEKINELLNLSISIITKIGNELTYYESQSKEYTFSIDHPREIKAVVDNTVEKKIIDLLAPTGISILSEESGFIQGVSSSKLYFIIFIDMYILYRFYFALFSWRRIYGTLG